MTEGTLALTAEEPTGSHYAQNAVTIKQVLKQTEINNGFSSIADHTVPIRFLSDDC